MKGDILVIQNFKQEMERRANINKKLRDIHKGYPQIWETILKSIGKTYPVFTLGQLGWIVSIKSSLYLTLNNKYTSKWTVLTPQIQVNKLFNPQLQIPQQKSYPSGSKEMVIWISDFLEKHILGAHDSSSLFVVDLGILGKLVISRNSIEFINGPHNWKYGICRDRVQLPRLLRTGLDSQDQILKMGRKFSLSLQKNKEKSNEKELNKSRLQRRSLSSSKIQSPSKRKVHTEQTKQLAQSFYQKKERKKLAMEPIKPSKLRIKTDVYTRTEISEVAKRNYSPFSHQNTIYDQSFHKRQVSRSKQSSRTKTLTEQKQKRSAKSYLPLQRKKLKISQGSEKQSKLQQVMGFLSFMNCKPRKQVQLQEVKWNEFQNELGLIYIQKMKKSKDNKYKYEKQLLKLEAINPHGKIKKPKGLTFLTRNQKQAYSGFYSLVESHIINLRGLKSDYLVNYNQHQIQVQNFITLFQAAISLNPLPLKLQIPVCLLLHEYFNQFVALQKYIIKKLVSSQKRIQIVLTEQMPFSTVKDKFMGNCSSPAVKIQGLIRDHFPGVVKLQSHQIENMQKVRKQFEVIFCSCQDKYTQNLQGLNKETVDELLQTIFESDKQAIDLVNKLNLQKQILNQQQSFKSELINAGILFNLSEVKTKLLSQLNHKHMKIYQHYHSIFVLNQRQLSSKLREQIQVSVDMLSDFHFQQYRQSLTNRRMEMLKTLKLIIYYFGQQAQTSVFNTYFFSIQYVQDQIKTYFVVFDQKLLQFKIVASQNARVIDQESRSNKKRHLELTRSLKLLLQGLTGIRSIFEKKEQILRLERQYNNYSEMNEKLRQLMKQNEMIYWQDDTFFITEMSMLKKALSFFSSPHYKTLFNTLVNELSSNQFYSSMQEYKLFMGQISNSRIQKLFKNSFSLLQQYQTLIELFLYRQYSKDDLNRYTELQIDMEQERGNRIYALVKKYESWPLKKIKVMKEIYKEAKISCYREIYQYNAQQVQFKVQGGSYEINFIGNVEELRVIVAQKNQIKWNQLLYRVEELGQLYSELILTVGMLHLIGNMNLQPQKRMQIVADLKNSYEQILTVDVKQSEINHFRQVLRVVKNKYIEAFYIEKINIFSRYCLYSLQEIMAMKDWDTDDKIQKNIKILFEDIDEVACTEGIISSVLIGKDCMQLQTPINIQSNERDTAKLLFGQLKESFRKNLERSEFASIQLKLLNWFIFYTQQVEVSLLSGQPLIKLKGQIQQIIKDMAKQLRYDLKLYRKANEISQLKFFIDNLHTIKHIQSQESYEWQSAIRIYEKMKVIIVKQFGSVFQYGFEPRQVLAVNPNYLLNTQLSYGIKTQSQTYSTSAYILGQPYKTLTRLQEYGFRQNYVILLTQIKKYCFFIRVVVDRINFRSVNYLHKKILEIGFKREQKEEQKVLVMPIFIEYTSYEVFPACFPEQIRSFTSPQLSLNISYLFMLKINQYTDITDKWNVNLGTISRLLTLIGTVKALTMKDLDNFILKFTSLLSEQQNLYKQCYKFFVNEWQVQITQEMQGLMNGILIKKQQSNYQNQLKSLTQTLNNFMANNKEKLFVYGPFSFKTHTINQALSKQIQGNVKHVEGIKRYLDQREISKEQKVIIEDRFIWNIDNNLLEGCQMCYISSIGPENCEFIFTEQLKTLTIQGNLQIFYKIFKLFHQTYSQIQQQSIPLLGMQELIVQALKAHYEQAFNKIQEEDQRQNFKFVVSKSTIYFFVILLHQIYYYLTHPKYRRILIERLKKHSLIRDTFNQDLSIVTCRGLDTDKIVSFLKKENRDSVKKVGFTKELYIINKYIELNMPVLIQYENSITSDLVKQYTTLITKPKIVFTLTDRYMGLLGQKKLSGVVYVIDDLHMAKKQNITSLKSYIEHNSNKEQNLLFFSKGKQYRKMMKCYITLILVDLTIEQIFKYQTKEGIHDSIQQVSKKLWEKGFFQSQQQYFNLIIGTTLKLPSQYYKKLYAKQLMYLKLIPCQNTYLNIQENQTLIIQMLNLPSEKSFLCYRKGHHQELSYIQVGKRMEQLTRDLPLLQKIVYKQIYKNLLPYLFTENMMIVHQEIQMLAKIVAALQDRPLFTICQNFMTSLTDIIDQMYQSESQFILVIQEPVSSSVQWEQFMRLYLKGHDVISCYQQMKEYWQQQIKKEAYIFRNHHHEIQVRTNIQTIILNRIRFIVCSKEIDPYPGLARSNIAYFNCIPNSEIRSIVVHAILTQFLKNKQHKIQNILNKYQPLITILVEKELISLNRIQHFLLELTHNIQQQINIHQGAKEQHDHKQYVLSKLNDIKNDLQEVTNQWRQQLRNSKMVLDGILEKIVQHERMQTPPEMQTFYFEHLIEIRKQFLSLHHQNLIHISQTYEQQFFNLIKTKVLKDNIFIQNNYIQFTLSTEMLQYLINDKEASKAAVKLYELFNIKQLKNFIPYQYFKYMLNIVEEYQKITFLPQFLQKEISQFNYFYLLDVSIELKKEYEVLYASGSEVEAQMKVVNRFIEVFRMVEAVDVNQEGLSDYFIFQRVKKVIRNHSVEVGEYPLLEVIQNYEQNFSGIRVQLSENCLINQEFKFIEFNNSLVQQNDVLVAYDPYLRIQKLCGHMGFKLRYIRSEVDLKTIFEEKGEDELCLCLKIPDIKTFKQMNSLSDKGIQTVKELKQKSVGRRVKLILMVQCKFILAKFQKGWPLLNLDHTLISFKYLLQSNIKSSNQEWSIIKADYLHYKSIVSKKIELVKTLTKKELKTYIANLQGLVNKFYQLNQILIDKTKTFIDLHQYRTEIRQIFKVFKQKDQQYQLPFNLTLRKLKHIDILTLLEVIKKPNKFQELFHGNSHCNFSNAERQLMECLHLSRYVIIVYEQFDKQKVKEMLRLQQTLQRPIKIIIDKSQQTLQEFIFVSSFIDSTEQSPSQIVLFFTQAHQLVNLAALLPKSEIMYI